MLYLTKKQVDVLVEHSKRESPNEACGMLAGLPVGPSGKDLKVEKVYEMSNTDKTPETFFMDSKEQLKAMKEIRNLGLEMVGIYHSHLGTEAYPSAHDVELAFYPEVSHVIVSIKDKDNPNIRAFKIKKDQISEEEVKIK